MSCLDNCGLEPPDMSGFGRVWSVFRGIQKTSAKGVEFRLYDIMGDHPQHKSTVTVDTLVREEIPITDMTEEEIVKECTKLKRYMRGDFDEDRKR